MDNHLLEVLNDKIILEILIQVSSHLPHCGRTKVQRGRRRPVVFLKNGGGKPLHVKTNKERTKERLNEESKCENALG